MSSEDYYRTLGVEAGASSTTIKKAYKKLALQHHPDKGGSVQVFQKISEAFSVLNDPQQRQTYDDDRNGSGRGGLHDFPGFASKGNFPSSAGGRQPFTQQDAFSMFDSFFADMADMHQHMHSHFHDRSHSSHTHHAQAARGGGGGNRRDAFNDDEGGDPFGMPFGGAGDILGRMLNGSGGGGRRSDPFSDPFFGGMGMGDMLQSFGGGSGGGAYSSSSSSSSFTSGGVTQGTSVSTRTTFDSNGQKKTIRETSTIGPDGQRHTQREEWVGDEGPAGAGSRRIAGAGGEDRDRRRLK